MEGDYYKRDPKSDAPLGPGEFRLVGAGEVASMSVPPPPRQGRKRSLLLIGGLIATYAAVALTSPAARQHYHRWFPSAPAKATGADPAVLEIARLRGDLKVAQDRAGALDKRITDLTTQLGSTQSALSASQVSASDCHSRLEESARKLGMVTNALQASQTEAAGLYSLVRDGEGKVAKIQLHSQRGEEAKEFALKAARAAEAQNSLLLRDLQDAKDREDAARRELQVSQERAAAATRGGDAQAARINTLEEEARKLRSSSATLRNALANSPAPAPQVQYYYPQAAPQFQYQYPQFQFMVVPR